MWVCKTCNEVNEDDRQATCRACNTDRNVVANPKNGWQCMKCGKRHSVRLSKCPICHTPRFMEYPSGGRQGSRPSSGFSETASAFASTLSGLSNGWKAAGGLVLLGLLAIAAAVWMHRYPSEAAVKRAFETTELARINAGFLGRSLDNSADASSGALQDRKTVSEMLQRLDADCKGVAPSAVLLEKTRLNVSPDYFMNDLAKLSNAVDAYLSNKIGPFGDGYSLKGLKQTGRRIDRSGGVTLCTIDYEATLVASSDVMIYRPPYLAGQEQTPLASNGAIDWPNYDRFYIAYKEQDSAAMRRAAAEFDARRGQRACAKGETQIVRGTLVLEKSKDGW